MAPANVETMFYYGKEPWHRIGTKLDNPATAAEAISAAGLDWNVEKVRTFFEKTTERYDPLSREMVQDKTLVEFEDRKTIVRTDKWTPFDVRSNRYTPFQNTEKFEFFDDIVGTGQAIYHTAGSLDGGAVTWILAKLPGDLKLQDDEILEKYILLADSYNGTASFSMKPTSVRVVCQNTLSIALGRETDKLFRARHTGDWRTKANEAREILGLQEAYFQMLLRGAAAMGNTPMKEEEVEPFLISIFEPNDVENIKTVTRNQMDRVQALFYDGIKTSGENRWDMMNAVSQWVDHEKGGKTMLDQTLAQDKRVKSAMFNGSGYAMKQNAWNILVPAGALD